MIKDMESKRLYKSYLDTHVEILVYIFMPIIQRELNEFLLAMPDRIGFTNQGSFVDESHISVAEQVIGIKHSPVWKNEDMYELLDCYCQIHSVKKPTCAEEGIDLYVKLLSMLQIDGFEV